MNSLKGAQKIPDFKQVTNRITKSADDEDVVSLGKLLNTLWRGKPLIAFAVFISLLGGIYLAYFKAVPTYQATAVVMLESR